MMPPNAVVMLFTTLKPSSWLCISSIYTVVGAETHRGCIKILRSSCWQAEEGSFIFETRSFGALTKQMAEQPLAALAIIFVRMATPVLSRSTLLESKCPHSMSRSHILPCVSTHFEAFPMKVSSVPRHVSRAGVSSPWQFVPSGIDGIDYNLNNLNGPSPGSMPQGFLVQPKFRDPLARRHTEVRVAGLLLKVGRPRGEYLTFHAERSIEKQRARLAQVYLIRKVRL
ncbi:hypothetical protein F4778DRAFT_639199 [Xylariomycetidae sp. FL2044]|nr:hypothetical protein F4778DRAFT_639199 [Xylariomycetidae sp. FL2044]